MSNVSKIGIIIIFLGILFLGFQFIDFENSTQNKNYRLIKQVYFNMDSDNPDNPTIIETNEEIKSNLNSVRFLIQGKLIARSKETMFDLGTIYKEETKSELFKKFNRTGNQELLLFDIKPKIKEKGIYRTKEFKEAYLIEPQFPDELLTRHFSISLNLDSINEYIYEDKLPPKIIKDDLSPVDKGLKISAVRKINTLSLGALQGTIPMLISIVIIVAGLVVIILGKVMNKDEVNASIEKEIKMEREVEQINIENSGEKDKQLHNKFKSINSRLKRINKLSKDSHVENFNEILPLCKNLADNAIKLSKFMVGFTNLKDFVDINLQEQELDELKIKYTEEKDFMKKTEILAKIKAKERIIFFLQNIEHKTEQIDDMISNVDALLENVILTYPTIKRDASVSGKGAISRLSRKLHAEIDIQNKELDMLEEVTKTSQKKHITGNNKYIEGGEEEKEKS